MMLLFLSVLWGCSEYHYSTAERSPFVPAEDTDVEPVEVEPEIPIAEAPVYANTSNQLYEVVPQDGSKVLVGSFHDGGGDPVDGFVDIAINLDGEMYGGTFDALYRIHPDTAEVSKVCDTTVKMYALTFTSEGRIIAGDADRIVEMDLGTCLGSALVDDAPYETSGDLVGLPDGYLYWTVRGDGSDELVRVDPDSGFYQWIGSLDAESLFGLGYDEGELYGFGKDGEIVRISPDQATAKLLSVDDQTSWWGATTNPVLW